MNFYMSYFARRAPQINIHYNAPKPTGKPKRATDVKNLPALISGVELDPNLLDFNLAASYGEVRLRFVYYYQIIEYAGFYWVEDSVKNSICKILQSPDLQTRLDEYIPRLLDALVQRNQDHEAKMRKVVEVRVNASDLWKEIIAEWDFFTTTQMFDGGFVVEPLVSKETTQDAFEKMWTPKIFNMLKNIRNALVHARENRSEAVILPTVANDERLRPWIPLIRRVAEQITIYDQ